MANVKQTKSDRTRRRILMAAAKVVGKLGYAKASVARITMEAGIASGGYYYYFKTRNGMFDELLPMLGEEMLSFISEHVKGTEWGLERETCSFEAYLAYLRKRPDFYRIFSEAYVYAQNAYNKHFTIVVENYVIALRLQKKKGFLNVRDDQFVMLAYFLMGIRNYITQMYMERDRKIKEDIEPAVDLYRKLLSGSVFSAAATAKAPRAARMRKETGTALAMGDCG